MEGGDRCKKYGKTELIKPGHRGRVGDKGEVNKTSLGFGYSVNGDAIY